ncbi:MAG: hypothetical protein ACLFWD_03865 [Anaerolineales bacterium]
MFENADVRTLVTLAGLAIILGLGAAMVLGLWVLLKVRRLRLPEGADFMTALRRTPLSVVILLDLLDFSLDFFGAPVAWSLLSYLGLKPLRGITVVEALIPGTQLLPIMTLAWLAARWLGRRAGP